MRLPDLKNQVSSYEQQYFDKLGSEVTLPSSTLVSHQIAADLREIAQARQIFDSLPDKD